jgi:hypothetical protein
MRMFTFDAAALRDTFTEQGWLHVPGGLSPELLAYIQDFTERARRDQPITGKGIQGAKDQFVLELPEGLTWEQELFDVVAPLCGLNRDTMALSERHIKAYSADAAPYPSAHKDRFASQISVGLSIVVPEGSHLVLYPDDEREPNPYLSGAHYASLDPDQLPDVVLAGKREVEIHDQPGDVILFHGSSTWHLRRHGAGTVVVYLKVNDFDCDPLGEDPTTATRRLATLDLLDRGAVAAARPVLSRRFESISREQRREGWPELLQANVWDSHPFPISELEAALLQRLDGKETVGDLAEREGVEVRTAIERLARRGALDLLPA